MNAQFIPVCEPFLDGNEQKYVTDALETNWISSAGKYIKLFEEKFAEYCNARYAVCVCNGTAALHLSLVASDINENDEVIIPNFTMIATAFAVCYTGANPVFIDAEPDTWNLNTELIERKITKRTKAIMPVSIFGHPCEMKKIRELSKKYNLKIIEDAAESIGAEYNSIKTGNLADITAFSFYANKNVTTGEGGMVVTNDENIYKKILYYKNLCFALNAPRNYIHDNIGYNYRMSNIHAAIGLAQIEKADYYRDLRVKNHNLYKKHLKSIEGISFQNEKQNCKNVYWMNGIMIDPSIYSKTRNELMVYLKSQNIDSRLFFVGMNRQPSLIKYGCNQSEVFNVTDWLSENGLYLPSSSNLNEEKIKYICDKIIEFKNL